MMLSRMMLSRPTRRWIYVCVSFTVLANITTVIFISLWGVLWYLPLFPMMIDYIKREGFFAEELNELKELKT